VRLLFGDVNGEENRAPEHTDHRRNTNSVQTATDQNAGDVQDKPIMGNAAEVSFATTVTGTAGSSLQPT